ncbi:hypothetical protein GCM10023224_28610 [Streptomonospora halophila]|uniref:Uncharacterized protein n=1 Tax=Streptomonospora halophila TaxID=427369 RepID=A0ABP9GIP3_9ACTN
MEPGNLRTKILSEGSMAVLPCNERYHQTVGESARYPGTLRGHQAGDPDTRVIVGLTTMDAPPRRLALGADGVEFAQAAAGQRLAAEDDRWRELGS